MNQTELITAVAECAGLTKADAAKAVEALIGTITEALTRGDEVRIAGFGSFGISESSERQGRNPQTGEAITIAASKAAKFTAAKAVKDALNGGLGGGHGACGKAVPISSMRDHRTCHETLRMVKARRSSRGRGWRMTSPLPLRSGLLPCGMRRGLRRASSPL